MVALVNGEGLLALSIGAGTGLGQAESTQPLAAAQLGQVLFLLGGSAVLVNGSGAQRGMGRQDNTGGAAYLGHFLNGHNVGQHIAACTADLFGEVDAHHAQLSHLLDGLFGEVFLSVDLLGQGLDFVFSKLLVHLLDHLLLFRQSKIHLVNLHILKQTQPDAFLLARQARELYSYRASTGVLVRSAL